MRTAAAVILCLTLAFGSMGCVPMVLIGAGAVGGYAASRDTFEGVSSKGQDEIWDAASHVLSIMGEVKNNDRKGGSIDAVVAGANVKVTVVPISLTATKLRVKARKTVFPRIATAQEVYSKIIQQLEQ